MTAIISLIMMLGLAFVLLGGMVVVDASVNVIGAGGKGISDIKDMSPTIGRGYSHSTGLTFSICLEMGELTPASYDYDFFLQEINSRESIFTQTAAKFEYSKLATTSFAHVDAEMSEESQDGFHSHFILGVMVVDRYFASVDETQAALSKDSESLLKDGSYISFIQTCGPTVIRGIRRTSEVVFTFKYTSKLSSFSINAQLMALYAKAKGGSKTVAAAFVQTDIEKYSQTASLSVTVKGVGLDLANPYSYSLMATSVDDFHDALETAYESMKHPGVGIIKSFEVVPWANSLQFQAAAQLDIKLLYPDGRIYPSDLKRFNFMINAEHISKMDEISKHRFNMINHLSHCMRALYSYDSSFLCSHWVIHRKQPFNNGQLYTPIPNSNFSTNPETPIVRDETILIQAARLKYLLDGYGVPIATRNDKLPIEQAIEDFQSYITNFYGPCLTELGGYSMDLAGGMLFTTQWLNIAQCRHPVCTMKDAYWDSGGCKIRVTNTWEGLVSSFCSPEFKRGSPVIACPS